MTPITSVTIYYFSGTGNSQNVGRWFCETAGRQNIRCTIRNIAEEGRHITPPQADDLVVIISPVHGFNYPPLVLGFLRRFPRGNNPVLLMNTRAGMLIGHWVTPGLTGIAFYFAAGVLMLKGYTIRGMVPVDMPSNWISVHPGLNKPTVEFLHKKNKQRVTAHAGRVLSGQSDFRALREIIQDILISPVSAGYYIAGRFILAKTYFASSACDNCGLCISNCPAKAIKQVDNRPYWTFKCESCMRCMSYCPRKAIETAHGFVAAIVLLYSGIMLGLMYKFINYFTPIENELVKFVAEWGLFLLMMGTGYRVIHYALRFKPFERFLVITSLTWYKFWGRRYKALRTY